MRYLFRFVEEAVEQLPVEDGGETDDEELSVGDLEEFLLSCVVVLVFLGHAELVGRTLLPGGCRR